MGNWPETLREAPDATKVALDFAVISVLGADHMATTREASGALAARKYAERELTYEDTAARCLREGIILKFIVITAQGAADPCSLKSLEVLQGGVAESTGQHVSIVRGNFMAKVALTILRASARATRRRHPDGQHAATRGQSKLVSQTRMAMLLPGALQSSPVAANPM